MNIYRPSLGFDDKKHWGMESSSDLAIESFNSINHEKYEKKFN